MKLLCLLYKILNDLQNIVKVSCSVMTHLYATDKLKNRRKDYRKFHRKYLKYLREEHSDRNTMYRFMFRLPYKTQQQVADELGVSRKTIARHNDDIPYSDWLTLTGVYAQVKKRQMMSILASIQIW